MLRRVWPVVLLAVLAGCGGSSLEEDDPRGQEACEHLAEAVRYEGDVEQFMGRLLLAGKAADKARTDGITDAVEPPVEGLEDFPIVDVDALTSACEDAGVEIPESTRD